MATRMLRPHPAILKRGYGWDRILLDGKNGAAT
jgi:hypothetical protein